MRKLIKVTQKDINAAKRGASRSCPISRALCREFGKIVDVHGNMGNENTIATYGPYCRIGNMYHIDLPRSAERFVRKFDENGKKAVKPFNFFIKV